MKAAAAQAEAEARDRAEARENAKKLQRAMLYLVKARFPELIDLAEQRARQIENPEVLDLLLGQISNATTEAEARVVLLPPAA